jgi:hypothetical protein
MDFYWVILFYEVELRAAGDGGNLTFAGMLSKICP